MEPDVIRLYSSSPPPMEDGVEEEDDEFGDFGGFSGVPNSVSFTEFDTPATFNQSPVLTATSPPELLNNGGVVGTSNLSCGSVGRGLADDLSKSNGVVAGGDGSPPERTVNAEELKKLADHSRPNHHSNSRDFAGTDYNGGDMEVLTNGFTSFEVQGNPPSSSSFSSQTTVCPHQTATSTEITAERSPGPEDDFADFAAFSNADVQGHHGRGTNASESSQDSEWGDCPAGGAGQQGCHDGQGSGSEDRDGDSTASDPPGLGSVCRPPVDPDGLSHGDESCRAAASSEQRDVAFTQEPPCPEDVPTREPVTQNGTESEGSDEALGDEALGDEDGVSPDAGRDAEEEQVGEKGSGNETETETETETSLGRPLSTDALEEYGDMSTTGSVPSPPLQEDMATPVDHSQLAEDDDGNFGDFGNAGSFGEQGFGDFEQPETREHSRTTGCDTAPAPELAGEEEFGDFDTPESHADGKDTGDGEQEEEEEEFAAFPGSDSFADFSSAPVAADSDADAGWNAFHEPEQGQGEGESWAAFGEDDGTAPSERSEDEWQESATATPFSSVRDDPSRRESLSASLSSRLEKLFQATFPETPVCPVGEEVLSLKTLLEPPERGQQAGDDGRGSAADHGGRPDVWRQLQDIHNSFGLRHQWGGSHSNKTLLCSLGIDTRNILFTGQRKQPVIVPMYAASLGMLEPTKEPVKPVSAAEMIASIAQAPPVAPEISTLPPNPAQETLPPVQFDWSSSGLTNPLDASGGSSLLNLDFFGPVEDSGSSSSTSIPGVDPELYELTTAKMDTSGSGSRVADAFARLMSTMEKTSTSTKKPRKEENLSAEAAGVLAGLPDLSFMQAKVLMFPTTLTPLGCSEPTQNSEPMSD